MLNDDFYGENLSDNDIIEESNHNEDNLNIIPPLAQPNNAVNNFLEEEGHPQQIIVNDGVPQVNNVINEPVNMDQLIVNNINNNNNVNINNNNLFPGILVPFIPNNFNNDNYRFVKTASDRRALDDDSYLFYEHSKKRLNFDRENDFDDDDEDINNNQQPV